MGLMTLEQSPRAYRADFAMYGAAVIGLAAFLVVDAPHGYAGTAVGWGLAGLVGWTAIEYALHRFVLHGLQPFRGWHEAHHLRPSALICAPTVFSASLIAALVFLPAWSLAGRWPACALTLGLLIGYFSYAVIHHAVHHWRADNAWLLQRKRWHARHHHTREPGCYGVTTAFWDHIFGSVRQRTDRAR
jgi:cyclopropane-fatty-acyl-phospholipid synthase